jgi:hypothetical protein
MSGLGFPLSSPLPSCHGPPHPCIPHPPHKQLLVALVGGAGCHWHHTPLITVAIVPPTIHPMSSCRAGADAISFPVTPSSPLLVLSWWPPLSARLSCSFLLFPHPFILTIPVVPSCHCCSTHHPPHEQLLMRLEAGGVGMAVPCCLLLTLVHLHL